MRIRKKKKKNGLQRIIYSYIAAGKFLSIVFGPQLLKIILYSRTYKSVSVFRK